jgi:hypothetical protein
LFFNAEVAEISQRAAEKRKYIIARRYDEVIFLSFYGSKD